MSSKPYIPYLPYLNYAEAVVTLTCQIISISLMSYLVYCALYIKKKLSVQHFPTSMVIYLLTHIVLSLLAMPYHLYITIKGKPGLVNNYDAYLMFWLGVLMMNYTIVGGISATFLTIDRFMTLRFFNQKFNRLRNCFYIFGILSAVSIFSICTALYSLELPLDVKRSAKCELFACLIIKTKGFAQASIKTTCATINVIIGLCFLFYSFNRVSGVKHLNNNVVAITLLMDTFFNTIPTYFAFVFTQVFVEVSSNFFGTYHIMFCCIDACCCSIFYYRVFLKNKTDIFVKLQTRQS